MRRDICHDKTNVMISGTALMAMKWQAVQTEGSQLAPQGDADLRIEAQAPGDKVNPAAIGHTPSADCLVMPTAGRHVPSLTTHRPAVQ